MPVGAVKLVKQEFSLWPQGPYRGIPANLAPRKLGTPGWHFAQLPFSVSAKSAKPGWGC